MEKVKFTQISRTICPFTGKHFLDAITDDGEHYVAEMRTDTEKWICYSKLWTKDSQQPYK